MKRGQWTHKKAFFFCAFHLIFFLLAAASFAADSSGESESKQGALPEVLIEAEHNKPLSLEKPPLDFQVEENEPVETLLQKTDRSLMDKLPTEIIQSNAFKPEVSVSSKVVVPIEDWIVRPWKGEPAHIFHLQKILSQIHAFKDNRSERKKSSWELEVADNEGKAFRRFSGRGLVPKKLFFDGRSDEGKWLQVGEVYMGVLRLSDSGGHIHTAYSQPFKLAGLSVKESHGFRIALDERVLFSSSTARPRLSSFGRELLSEAAQLVERYYPGFSLEAELDDRNHDQAWLHSAVLLCTKNLARRLLRPSADIAARWNSQASATQGSLNLLVHSQ